MNKTFSFGKKISLILHLFFIFLILINFNCCGIPEPINFINLPKLRYDTTINFIWFIIENKEAGFKGYDFLYSVQDNLNPIYFNCNVKVYISNNFNVSSSSPKLICNPSNLNFIVQIYFNDPNPSTITPEPNKLYVSIYDKDWIPFSNSIYNGSKIFFLVRPYVVDIKGEVIKTIDSLGTNIISINF
ncbi:MAG: hypothetical protein N3A58_01350 [Spirochaetes bacterium]|nr:hypothetical protein [Spirochaetota bacterium]